MPTNKSMDKPAVPEVIGAVHDVPIERAKLLKDATVRPRAKSRRLESIAIESGRTSQSDILPFQLL